jgi:hypothetical protein
MNVYPDFTAVNGAGGLSAAVGALLTFVLITAVGVLVVSAITWAIASTHANPHTAARAKTGVFVAAGAATLAGAAIALTNWLIDLGATL